MVGCCSDNPTNAGRLSTCISPMWLLSKRAQQNSYGTAANPSIQKIHSFFFLMDVYRSCSKHACSHLMHIHVARKLACTIYIVIQNEEINTDLLLKYLRDCQNRQGTSFTQVAPTLSLSPSCSPSILKRKFYLFCTVHCHVQPGAKVILNLDVVNMYYTFFWVCLRNPNNLFALFHADRFPPALWQEAEAFFSAK